MKSFQRSFRIASVAFLSVAVVALLAPSAFAQSFVIGPGGLPPTPPGGTTGGQPIPGGGVNPVIKTSPLSAGQLETVFIDVHNSSGAVLPNWAGVLVKIHLMDPSEVDIVAVRIGGVQQPHPFQVSGAGPGSTTLLIPVFHPAASFSGISMLPSSAFPAITLSLIGKNTDPVNNSDVDIKLEFADIYHAPGYTSFGTTMVHNPGPGTHISTIVGSTDIIRPTRGSTIHVLQEGSYHWLVPSSIDGGLPQLHMTGQGQNGHRADSVNPFPNAANPTLNYESKYHLPSGNPDTGKFIHLGPGTIHRVATNRTFHVTTAFVSSTVVDVSSSFPVGVTTFIPGSSIFAMPFLATATIGIEHVPEPAAPILLLCGIASLAFGFRSRRLRKEA